MACVDAFCEGDLVHVARMPHLWGHLTRFAGDGWCWVEWDASVAPDGWRRKVRLRELRHGRPESRGAG